MERNYSQDFCSTKHVVAAQARKSALHRVKRFFHRIPGVSLVNRAWGAFQRMMVIARDLCRLYYVHKLKIVRDMTEDWPVAAHFLPPRPPSALALTGKPSLLFFCDTLGVGGAERQLVNLAIRLHQAGHSVRVRLPRLANPYAHYAPVLREAGIDCRALPLGHMVTIPARLAGSGVSLSLLHAIPPGLRKATAALALELLREPVDIVHAFLDKPNIIAGWAGLLAGTPGMRLSCLSLNPTYASFYQPWMDRHYQWLARQPRIALECNSQAGARDYAAWLGLPEESFEICPNGVDLAQAVPLSDAERKQARAELGAPHDAPLVIAVGRVSPEKRPFDLLQIFLRIVELVPEAHCLHVGEGPLAEDMAHQLAGLPDPQKGRIHLLGLRHDVFRLLAASDLFVHCSAQEGLPNAIMEAMISGLPVVSTRAGGTGELVMEGSTGFLREVGDIAGLAEKTALLLQNPALREAMGRAGKKRMEEFSFGALVEREQAAYRKQLSPIGQGGMKPCAE